MSTDPVSSDEHELSLDELADALKNERGKRPWTGRQAPEPDPAVVAAEAERMAAIAAADEKRVAGFYRVHVDRFLMCSWGPGWWVAEWRPPYDAGPGFWRVPGKDHVEWQDSDDLLAIDETRIVMPDE